MEEHFSFEMERFKEALSKLERSGSTDDAERVCLASRRAYAAFLPAFELFGLRDEEKLRPFQRLLDQATSQLDHCASINQDSDTRRYADNVRRRGKLLLALREGRRDEFHKVMDQSISDSLSTQLDSHTCPVCYGSGRYVGLTTVERCDKCGGSGRVSTSTSRPPQ